MWLCERWSSTLIYTWAAKDCSSEASPLVPLTNYPAYQVCLKERKSGGDNGLEEKRTWSAMRVAETKGAQTRAEDGTWNCTFRLWQQERETMGSRSELRQRWASLYTLNFQIWSHTLYSPTADLLRKSYKDPANGPGNAGVSNKIRGRARSLARYSSNSWRVCLHCSVLELKPEVTL